MLLECGLKEQCMQKLTGFIWFRVQVSRGSCGHSNEHLKDLKFSQRQI
jgi:hypothetical protein